MQELAEATARPRSPSPHAALLAATALGFAYTAGATTANLATLASLAGPDPGALVEARDAVLEVEVVPLGTRQAAAELLGRASGSLRVV
jgi:hypothetical protein